MSWLTSATDSDIYGVLQVPLSDFASCTAKGTHCSAILDAREVDPKQMLAYSVSTHRERAEHSTIGRILRGN